MAASAILGPDGRPFERRVLATPQATPTVTGVRPVLSDHPATGLTPERLAHLLRASEEGDATAYLELAEDMEERDLHYRGVLGTRKLSVAQLDMTVDAASDAPADVAAADLVREWMAGMDMEDVAFDLLDGLGKGYSVMEIGWDTQGGRWWPRTLEHRDPRWFRFDRTDGRTLRLVDGTPDGAPLAPYKFVTHTPKTKSGLPIRGGLARAAAWAFLFKNYTVKDWVVFAEVYGHPLRLGKWGNGASERDKDTLLRAVRDLGSDAAAIIPAGMEIQFVSSSASGTDLWERLADWLDRQVSKAVLGQTATTDAIAGGHAVGQEHRQVQQDIERADARQLAAPLNRDLVPPLVAFNLGPRPAYPTIRIGREKTEDVTALIANTVKLVDYGMAVEASVLRDKLGLPDPPKGATLLVPPGRPAAPPAGPGGTATAAAGTGGAFDLDAAIAEQLAAEGWDMGGIVDPVRALLAAQPDMAAAVAALRDPAALARLFAAMDTRSIEEALVRGGFAARLAGLAGGGDAP